MQRNLIFAFTLLLSVFAFSFSFGQSNSATHQFDEKLYQTLTYRNIGPFRGGRSTTVTGVPGDIFTYYQGTTGGGVWKTTDGGTSWQNISDGFF
jgi:hypothetical protein